MWLLFLDEFGHPDLSQSDESHRAFGYAGVLVKATDFDRLSQQFMNIKGYALMGELSASEGPHSGSFWVGKLGRKKLRDLMRERESRTFLQNGELERGGHSFKSMLPHKTTTRFLNCMRKSDAEIFIYGYEKKAINRDFAEKPPVLMVSLLEGLIDRVAQEAKEKRDEVVIFFDRHSCDPMRSKMMRDSIYRKKYYDLIRKSPAFSDSDWSQGIQIADWLCFLTGRIMGQYCQDSRLKHAGYRKEYGETFFGLMSNKCSFYTVSSGEIRTKRHEQLPLPLPRR